MSNIIKGFRTLKGYNQDDMSKMLNMAEKTYCRKENNPNLFTVAEIKILSHVLEVDESVFFKDKVTVSVN